MVIVLMGIASIMFGRDYKKSENKFFLWISLSFVTLVISRCFRVIVTFYIGEPPVGEPFTGIAYIFENYYILLGYIAFFFLYFALERNILKKTHYIFSTLVIITCIIAIINFALNNIVLLYITGAFFVVTVIGLPLIFFNLALKSTGTLRKNSFLVMIGIILTVCGLAFDIPEARTYWVDIPGFLDIIKFIAPVLQMGGIMFLRVGFRKFT